MQATARRLIFDEAIETSIVPIPRSVLRILRRVGKGILAIAAGMLIVAKPGGSQAENKHARTLSNAARTSRCSSRTPHAAAWRWADAATPRTAPAAPRGRDTLERDPGVRC